MSWKPAWKGPDGSWSRNRTRRIRGSAGPSLLSFSSLGPVSSSVKWGHALDDLFCLFPHFCAYDAKFKHMGRYLTQPCIFMSSKAFNESRGLKASQRPLTQTLTKCKQDLNDGLVYCSAHSRAGFVTSIKLQTEIMPRHQKTWWLSLLFLGDPSSLSPNTNSPPYNTLVSALCTCTFFQFLAMATTGPMHLQVLSPESLFTQLIPTESSVTTYPLNLPSLTRSSHANLGIHYISCYNITRARL